MKKDIEQIFNAFQGLKVAVVGDLMLDTYIKGKVTRISPEAPVPIVNKQSVESRLGGSGNVALNVKALGAHCYLFSVVGTDQAADEIQKLLLDAAINFEGILKAKDRITTRKTRVLGNNAQLLRIDEETTQPIKLNQVEQVCDKWNKFITKEKPDVVILQDYNKGYLTSKLISFLLESCSKHNIKVCVDPKKENFLAYKNVDLFKPNLKELAEGLGLQIDASNANSIQNAINLLMQKTNPQSILLTLSEKGVWYQSQEKTIKDAAHIRNIADVSGAGDTVISIAALCLAIGTTPEVLAKLSNLGGGLVCEKIGVVPIDKNELRNEAQKILV